jgi:methionyl-tRNA formyltransferase
MRIVFMGTTDFAALFLEALPQNGHPISLVVTQPDRPKGRGQKPAAPPVKEKALELGLPVVQPESLKSEEFRECIAAQNADLLVVVAFRILPPSLFPLTRFGAVNVHGSLLPKYRGAAPVQWAIANGETETGVTVFRLDGKIDHGGILASLKTGIGPDETAGELFARLSGLGRNLLMAALTDLENGCAVPMEQDHTLATPAPKLRKEDGRLDWSLPAKILHNRVRAFNPYPICYTPEKESGRILRIHCARSADGPNPGPGRMRVDAEHFPVVGTGEGALRLLEVQWEGNSRMSGPDFINGLRGRLLRFI